MSSFIIWIRKVKIKDTTDFSESNLLFGLNNIRSSDATTKMLNAKLMPALFFFFIKFLSAFFPFGHLKSPSEE